MNHVERFALIPVALLIALVAVLDALPTGVIWLAAGLSCMALVALLLARRSA